MLKVVSCLAYEHDHAFVVVAAIVCVAGAVMTIRLFDRTQRLSVQARALWVILSGLAGGAAIWTTHFVAMLGFQLPVDHAFNPALTIASLLIATGFTAAGLHLAADRASRVPGEVGGAVIGIGIVGMHFTGMAGLEVAGRIEWDWTLVAASTAFALCLGALTTHIMTRRSFRFSRPLAIVTLVLAICSMHFTGMGAAVLIPDPSVSVPPRMFSSEFLAVLVVAILAVVAGVVIYGIDARTQRELIDSFRYAALHDALTGLPNRAYLSANLPEMLERSRRSGTKAAVVVIDLDRFKEINDVHGHHAGDRLLQNLADRLSLLVRADELVARVGGDEFVAVKPYVQSKREVDDFARRLVACALDPVQENGSTLSVGASVGVSLYPDDSHNAEDLICAADLAMYRAKRSLGNKICHYQSSMDEGRRERSALAIELRQAVAQKELELYYQPQCDVQSGEVRGYEALLRWHHRGRGTIQPADFIPIAEETGLIVPIGEWVLKTACQEAANWSKPYKLAVNIASAQLTRADLPKVVHETLLATGLPASRLELEITEASIIVDRDRALHVVRQLKALGVAVAMDDYGTGYSTLSTLQMFPFDKVKIDRTFVEGMTTDSASAAIVRATIQLASDLKISVLAEGVERQEHFDFLQAEGCAEVQGFLFGRPQPMSEIPELAGHGQRRASVHPARPAWPVEIPLGGIASA